MKGEKKYLAFYKILKIDILLNNNLYWFIKRKFIKFYL